MDRVVSGAVSRSAEAGSSVELLPLVYDELRRLAAARLSNEPGTQTLQPTALVHEAFVRMAGCDQQTWDNRGHFFAAAAEAMRRVLVDRARRKLAQKRGVRPERLNLDEVDLAVDSEPEVLLAVHEALEGLSRESPESAELVKLRFFVGLEYSEAAQILGVSERSAKRHWTFAKAWLYRELSRASATSTVA
jgi:RNA polymerase sigma factor (TIGR02999 family)